MFSAEDLCSLIQKGGVKLPSGLDAKRLQDELVEREKILSTAVGNGIALPHPHRKVIDDPADQRIAVCFLKDPIDMQAPDSRKVYVYFILLTSASQKHLDILSGIANLAKDREFKALLETRPDEATLLDGIRRRMA